jgi:hypothetical protein
MDNEIDFNWKNYCTWYTDLRNAGINTEQLATRHYIDWGIRECRKPNPIIPSFNRENFLNKKLILIITHGRGGGSIKYINDIVTLVKSRFPEGKSDIEFITLEGFGNDVIVHIEQGEPGIRFNIFFELDNIIDFLLSFKFHVIHVNHIIDFPLEHITKLIEQLKLKYIISIHDWFFLSGQFDLCEYKPNQIITNLLEHASAIFVPSQSTFLTYNKSYPNAKFIFKPHENVAPINLTNNNILKDRFFDTSDKIEVHIGIFGIIRNFKGSNLVLKCAGENNRIYYKDTNFEGSVTKKIDIFYHIYGRIDIDPSVLTGFPNIICHGEYKNANDIDVSNIDIFWLPSVWKETYSYVLTEYLQHAKPICAANYPIVKDRCKGMTGIYTYPPDSSVEKILYTFVQAASGEGKRSGGSLEHYKRIQVMEPINKIYGHIYDRP